MLNFINAEFEVNCSQQKVQVTTQKFHLKFLLKWVQSIALGTFTSLMSECTYIHITTPTKHHNYNWTTTAKRPPKDRNCATQR